MVNPCSSVQSVGEFKNHPHGKFVRFEILLPFGQWVYDKSRVQKKSVFSVSIRVQKIFVRFERFVFKKYHPHGKSVLFEQSNNALHEELASDPTGANFATTENSKNHPIKSRIKNILHSSDDKRRAILRWRIIM